ncbi:DUF1090 family protein [Pantoea ananatis]
MRYYRESRCFLFQAPDEAQSLCQQKEQDIQREIEMAQKHNNQRRVNGLERALTGGARGMYWIKSLKPRI